MRLQMLPTRPDAGTLSTSVADGDSLRHYPTIFPAAARCRRSTPPQPPRRRLDGSLTIGDTHAYDEPFAFDVDEDACEHLRGRAEKLLGAQLPPTQRRWAGVYSQVTSGEFYHRSAVAPGVVLVTGPGGRGMTCAPAIAGETFA
jgi:glycine/D-amino acid oxidase-like deaminating enzyme